MTHPLVMLLLITKHNIFVLITATPIVFLLNMPMRFAAILTPQEAENMSNFPEYCPLKKATSDLNSNPYVLISLAPTHIWPHEGRPVWSLALSTARYSHRAKDSGTKMYFLLESGNGKELSSKEDFSSSHSLKPLGWKPMVTWIAPLDFHFTTKKVKYKVNVASWVQVYMWWETTQEQQQHGKRGGVVSMVFLFLVLSGPSHDCACLLWAWVRGLLQQIACHISFEPPNCC